MYLIAIQLKAGPSSHLWLRPLLAALDGKQGSLTAVQTDQPEALVFMATSCHRTARGWEGRKWGRGDRAQGTGRWWEGRGGWGRRSRLMHSQLKMHLGVRQWKNRVFSKYFVKSYQRSRSRLLLPRLSGPSGRWLWHGTALQCTHCNRLPRLCIVLRCTHLKTGYQQPTGEPRAGGNRI